MLTNDQILEMLKQVGMVGKNHTGTGDYMNQFVDFARLIAERQKEIDAVICENILDWRGLNPNLHITDADACAAAIRKGGAA